MAKTYQLAKITKAKRRLGRGIGSQGAKSGRGMKGQGARAGFSRRAGFEGGQTPLFQRLPKKRGAKARGRGNNTRSYVSITTGNLTKFKTNSIVGPGVLRAAGLITQRSDRVKLIYQGELSQPLTVRVHATTLGAKKAVTQAGGKLEIINSNQVHEATK